MDNVTTSPDPVLEPRAYQQMLLGLLGDDDPHEVQEQNTGEPGS